MRGLFKNVGSEGQIESDVEQHREKISDQKKNRRKDTDELTEKGRDDDDGER